MARILIVDDEDNIRMLIKEELEDSNFEIVDAPSAKKALQILSNDQEFDIVCTDIEMPDMNGLELAGEIRKKYPNKKIILLTAYSHYKSEMASWAADAYVVKSMDLTELKETINNLLKL
ncbi:two-component system response regulator [Tepiditoga spiralis]|uniref:Two-component system response regulator n=1 Tax=Tepiditoga spiralis TaxID=2108365 RepID=A0A7G1G2Y8_9BACT|nr:response regulator [Tepiditoga spiralis]BBE30691.1 two-component system response regulator [Tepiditoga spiralis]